MFDSKILENFQQKCNFAIYRWKFLLPLFLKFVLTNETVSVVFQDIKNAFFQVFFSVLDVYC